MADSLEFKYLRNNPRFVKEFSQYQKGDFIGRGRIANGGVYSYKYMSKEYAVKIYTEKKSDCFSHILREISILDTIGKVIKSENIIRFHGFYFEIIGNSIQFYIIMDKAEGTLTEIIKKKRHLTMSEILDITNQFLITFAEFEGNGITHRDIKTDNILFVTNYDDKIQIKITDFSEGKVIDTESTHNTLVGNTEHLSPELYYSYRRGDTDIKYNPFKNDVYGLGVLLIQLASLEYRPARKEEAKIDPFNNDKGPCDEAWNVRIAQTKAYYVENNENIEKSLIDRYFLLLKEMIQYNPKNRPRFYQILYKWMNIYSLKIISIEQENKYIQQITQLEEKNLKLELNGKKNLPTEVSNFRRFSEMSQLEYQDISADDMKFNSSGNFDNLHQIKEQTSSESSDDQSDTESSEESISQKGSLKDIKDVEQNDSLKSKKSNESEEQTIKRIDLSERRQKTNSVSQINSEVSTPESCLNKFSVITYPSFKYLFQDNDNNIISLDGKKKDVIIIKNRTDLKQINKNSNVIQLNELNDAIKNELILTAENLRYLIFHLHSKKTNTSQINLLLQSFGHSLIFLNLNIGSWQGMKDQDVKSLCEGIQQQKCLQVIYLQLWEWGMENTAITDKSLEYIGQTLSSLSTLMKIKLGLDRWGLDNKNITDNGLNTLLNYLQKLQSLAVLDLSLARYYILN